jgi:hypothetical protein
MACSRTWRPRTSAMSACPASLGWIGSSGFMRRVRHACAFEYVGQVDGVETGAVSFACDDLVHHLRRVAASVTAQPGQDGHEDLKRTNRIIKAPQRATNGSTEMDDRIVNTPPRATEELLELLHRFPRQLRLRS